MLNELNSVPNPQKSPITAFGTLLPSLEPVSTSQALARSIEYMLSLQRSDGYWWFTLEANETIGAEFIFLMHFMDQVDSETLAGIAQRIRDVQRADGTWALYHDGPPDLSSTVECYFALKLAGDSPEAPHMRRAKAFILSNGGIEASRVFTKIHLALFGIVPWDACPAMPVEAMLLPNWFPINIYEFSSWARASIVPLLVVLTLKPIKELPENKQLDELFCLPHEHRKYRFKTHKGIFSWEYGFIQLDKHLKQLEKLPVKPLRKKAIEKAKKWIWDHLQHVEDIYPALAYAAIAFRTLGYDNDEPEVRKAFEALLMFQQRYATKDVPAIPQEIRDNGIVRPSTIRMSGETPFNNDDPLIDIVRGTTDPSACTTVHQQCCVSPVWDTPWTGVALLDAGLPADHPALLAAARWLIKKQITHISGDWSIKCKHAEPGGWAFEFENDQFPDVDDTVQVLHLLNRAALPAEEKAEACRRALNWILAMQNDDGGWGAFDKNNHMELLNRLPFSDHGACLDPSSPDIAGRIIELLATHGYTSAHPQVARALKYLSRTQEHFGGWFGRWGINYIYGTWCAITGICAINGNTVDTGVQRAADWLKSIQRADGGWGESPEGYLKGTYVPLDVSLPSQTAWAIMGLVAAGEAQSEEVQRGVQFLLDRQNAQGAWDEQHHTGTGFPGHFYIRYHGYRHYFPMMALARYRNSL